MQPFIENVIRISPDRSQTWPILEKPRPNRGRGKVAGDAAQIEQRCGESHTRFGKWPPPRMSHEPIRHPSDARYDSEKPAGASLAERLSGDGGQSTKRILKR
jgi:hypothetical protein